MDQLVGSLSPPPSFSSFFFLSTISCFEFPVSRRNNEFRKMYKLARMDFTSILYSQICLIFLKTQEYKYQFLSRPREINSFPRFSYPINQKEERKVIPILARYSTQHLLKRNYNYLPHHSPRRIILLHSAWKFIFVSPRSPCRDLQGWFARPVIERREAKGKR